MNQFFRLIDSGSVITNSEACENGNAWSGKIHPENFTRSQRQLEFDLLLCLMRSAGRVLNRDTLLDEIAGRDYDVFDRSIDVHISSLRRKPGDDSKNPWYIKTVPGKSINHLAERLSGFVHGQKRFLGDISHELNSPLARMQFSILIEWMVKGRNT